MVTRRYSLDIAHVIDGRVLRYHYVNLKINEVIDLEVEYQALPGRVYVERGEHVYGDPPWCLEWAAVPGRPERLAF
jgi:hypothetical protein